MSDEIILKDLCRCQYNPGSFGDIHKSLQTCIRSKRNGRCFRNKIEEIPSLCNLKQSNICNNDKCLQYLCDVLNDLPFLRFSKLAIKLGAWQAIQACCTFCNCRHACCTCSPDDYTPRDADRACARRGDMHYFDTRLKTDLIPMKIMYL